MYICFWIGASESRAYIVGLIEKQPSELGVGLTRVPCAKKDSCEKIQQNFVPTFFVFCSSVLATSKGKIQNFMFFLFLYYFYGT